MSWFITEDFILDARINAVSLDAQAIYARFLAASKGGKVIARDFIHLRRMITNECISSVAFDTAVGELESYDLVYCACDNDNNYVVIVKPPLHPLPSVVEERINYYDIHKSKT